MQEGAAVVKKDGSVVGNALSYKEWLGGLMCGSGEKNGKQMSAVAVLGRKTLIKRQRIDPRTK
ncbi:MAG: hypothetical protein CMI17_06975 [Opitutaceae bacterium]|nr:hypothetical protein [Opitutaceae bacterium]